MKKIILLTLIVVMPLMVQAQQTLFNLNYSIGLPLGDSKDYIGAASFRGVSFEGRNFINDNLSIGGYLGWNVFNEVQRNANFSDNGIDINGTQYRFLNVLPIQVITHFYLNNFEGINPYAGIGLGATRSWQRTEIGLVAFENNNWHLGISPEIGVYIPINFNLGMNISARYDYAMKSNDSTYSNLTFNIGFSFLDY